MWMCILIPLLAQCLIIGCDEYYFHIKRGLPKWERIGHPLDTLTVLGCLLFVIWVPYSPLALKWYIGLAIFSSLFVTKDEWVHKHHCPAAEQWLHALLFINHPIVLTSVGFLWFSQAAPAQLETLSSGWLSTLVTHLEPLGSLLPIQAGGIFVFLLYQIIYWNIIWKPEKKEADLV